MKRNPIARSGMPNLKLLHDQRPSGECMMLVFTNAIDTQQLSSLQMFSNKLIIYTNDVIVAIRSIPTRHANCESFSTLVIV